MNFTIKPFSDEFINQFCTKIDEIISKENGIRLSCQITPGGGAFRAKGNDRVGNTSITSVSHRDSIYGVSFDLFYLPGYEQRANELQEEMQDILDISFHNDSREQRLFAFTFGDTNIRNPKIREMYYDSEEDYKRLQQLKFQVDPTDVFSTSLTVKLPESHKGSKGRVTPV